jgi:hypothetical protein
MGIIFILPFLILWFLPTYAIKPMRYFIAGLIILVLIIVFLFSG